MVLAWKLSKTITEQRDENQRQPPCPVSSEDLEALFVFCLRIDPLDHAALEEFMSKEGYNYHDIITVSRNCLPEYEKKVRMFFQEHTHADPEVRFILEGAGYFDVRDAEDEWIRIRVTKGDLVVIPAGIYHRFSPDHQRKELQDYIEAVRLFKGDPVWTPLNRPAEAHPTRGEYLKQMEALHKSNLRVSEGSYILGY